MPNIFVHQDKNEDSSIYVNLSVENIMTNFRAIMVYVFHFGLIIYRKVNSV